MTSKGPLLLAETTWRDLDSPRGGTPTIPNEPQTAFGLLRRIVRWTPSPVRPEEIDPYAEAVPCLAVPRSVCPPGPARPGTGRHRGAAAGHRGRSAVQRRLVPAT